MKSLLTFLKGGVHPPEAKGQTASLPIERMPVPKELEIILGQHIGAPCTPTVNKRDEVVEGAMIGEVKKGLGVPLHAPVSGKIKDIGTSAHPMRVSAPSITITVDHEAAPVQYDKTDWTTMSAQELLAKVQEGGIVGIGGAGFPTHVKLSPPKDAKIDQLLLNGAECEPYITADHRQMLEHADEVVEGARIIMKILGVSECKIGIESNKPDAIDVMGKAAAAVSGAGCNIVVQPLEVKYPQGSEKQLIQAITGRKVPAMALPSAVGVVVQNVATASAIYDAVVYGKPLYEKVVTISGKGINKPANLLVKVGTKVSDIVDYLGGVKPELAKIIMGGPMMGFAVSSLDIPITKTTSSILFLTEDEIDATPHSDCIRCGWCLDACPMGLEPKEIAIHVEANKAEDTAQFGVFDCFECGSCAYICPAKRPLVQFVRLAKMKAKR
ncbi:electron transport complex subunit RsxC [Desulfopila aestuarii]|uniref:Ion-translocating oxidoreductase complex subunit C n=1 Tax=Desulfopila aestuarii DSM 18488 TaxID=1121416 RepID=A0A1M7Y6M3_9BACT|nr:electron transport complex subunit RsxC [Desulfopila aestuarii]SHO48250.1 electron transport complex protein RnfC [Desulfopila aestuarii DSM 18488]